MIVQFGRITKPPMVAKRRINEMGLNKPITPIYSLDPNGVAVCPSGFDCVRYAHSAQDDNQAFVLCTWYNGNNGRFVNRPYKTTVLFGHITKQAMPAVEGVHEKRKVLLHKLCDHATILSLPIGHSPSPPP